MFGEPGRAAEPPVDVKTLHAKIGELALENDFFRTRARQGQPAERQTMIDRTHALPNHSPVASRYLPRLRLYRKTGPLLPRDRSMATALHRESRSPLGR